MIYTTDIENSPEALIHCLKMLTNRIPDFDYDWTISVNAGGIDYGVYFNFDTDSKELEISNQPAYGVEESYLDDIIDAILEESDEETGGE